MLEIKHIVLVVVLIFLKYNSVYGQSYPCTEFAKACIYITGNVHEEKEYSSSDYSEDNSYKKEENALNSEIKEEIYEEDDRNEEDSSNKIENQRDVENKDNQEQRTPPSSV